MRGKKRIEVLHESCKQGDRNTNGGSFHGEKKNNGNAKKAIQKASKKTSGGYKWGRPEKGKIKNVQFPKRVGQGFGRSKRAFGVLDTKKNVLGGEKKTFQSIKKEILTQGNQRKLPTRKTRQTNLGGVSRTSSRAEEEGRRGQLS